MVGDCAVLGPPYTLPIKLVHGPRCRHKPFFFGINGGLFSSPSQLAGVQGILAQWAIMPNITAIVGMSSMPLALHTSLAAKVWLEVPVAVFCPTMLVELVSGTVLRARSQRRTAEPYAGMSSLSHAFRQTICGSVVPRLRGGCFFAVWVRGEG